MPFRTPLPPPPPPVAIRTWPDRDALLRDRAAVLADLVARQLGPGRIAAHWGWAVLLATGWAFVGTAVIAFTEALDVLSVLYGAVCLVIGLGALVPTAVAIVAGLRKDARIRRLLAQWAALDRHPATDAALRAPGLSLAWLLPGGLMCAVGLFVCVTVPAGARPGDDTYGVVVLGMGLGLVCWLTGLIAVNKALSHRRWALRLRPSAHLS
ncbi:hypothetical protein AB0M57_15465 [Streptomyces sp. NPDC051597]|uniref:hypothetical protein n=1 Tax=Streptomyces sp. NPDC051597 TaxID=3155049 RepID=UPI00341DB43B